MNQIKRYKTALGVAVALATASLAFGQGLGSSPTLISSGTNCILAATQLTTAYGANGLTSTTGGPAFIDCTSSKELALEWIGSLTAAGTSDKTLLYFYRNISGSRTNYETTAPYFIWGITPNGTTPVVAVTNLTVSGVPYLICAVVTNGVPTTAALTNFTLRAYTTKR